jgi:hypothetical protein
MNDLLGLSAETRDFVFCSESDVGLALEALEAFGAGADLVFMVVYTP